MWGKGFIAVLIFCLAFVGAAPSYADEKTAAICHTNLLSFDTDILKLENKIIALEQKKNEEDSQFHKNQLELLIINAGRQIRELKAARYLAHFPTETFSREDKRDLESALQGLLASGVTEDKLPPLVALPSLLLIFNEGQKLKHILNDFYSSHKNQVWDQFLKIDFQAQYDIVRKQADENLRAELQNITNEQLRIFTESTTLKAWAFSVESWNRISALITPEYIFKHLRTAVLNPDKRYCCETTCFTCPFNYPSKNKEK